ncbi:MAG: EpsI family protein [Candidatus Firestonebacteria bacterium]|nr:EpsI family protein [Candidatus Firestonebacteria bacterium]
MDISRKKYWILIGIFFLLALGVYPMSFKYEIWPEDLHLENFPKEIGEWKVISKSTIKEDFFTEDDNREARKIGFKTLTWEYENSKGNSIVLYIGYFNYREGPFNHEPARCYVSQGWDLLDETSLNIQSSRENIEINKVFAQKGAYQQIALYWYQMGNEIITDRLKYQMLLLKNTLFKGRSDGVVVSITGDAGTGNIKDIVNYEQDFAKEILPIISKYLPK